MKANDRGWMRSWARPGSYPPRRCEMVLMRVDCELTERLGSGVLRNCLAEHAQTQGKNSPKTEPHSR
jgi:hypothetical protein